MPEKLADTLKAKSLFYSNNPHHQHDYSAGYEACYEELEPLIEALKRIRDNANTIGYLPESHFVSNNSVAIFNSNDIARTALKKVGIE